MELNLLNRGRGWFAVDKPCGVSVHNEPGHDALTLADRLLRATPELQTGCEWDREFSPVAVHRLDKETSGVLIFATQAPLARQLAEAFAERSSCVKIYRAVVRGSLNPPRGAWTDPLTDRAEGLRDPAGPAHERKACETRFEVLRQNPYFSELRVELLSGRQHQIRRHARLHGHVVVGDTRYGKQGDRDRVQKIYGVDRLMLHAQILRIASLGVEAEAAVPEDFDRLFPDAPKAQ